MTASVGESPRSLHVALLGHLLAEHNGTTIPLGAPRQRAVLAMLALAPGRVVPVDALIDGLWGAELPSRPQASIQVYVHGLRKALADHGADRATLTSQPPGYRLSIDGADTDVGQFERLWRQSRAEADRADALRARDTLARGLALWRGEALADLRRLPFAMAPVARLDEMRLAAQEDLIDLRLACGEHTALATELEELTASHPMRERLWGQLMIALYRSDRQVDALAAYARARDRLADELGLDPGAALQRLETGILRHDPELAAPQPMSASPAERAPVAEPAPTPIDVHPRREGRIPHEPTPLIGREELIDEIVRRITGAMIRAVSLVGPGGTGKTRVAWAVAERLADHDSSCWAVVAEPGRTAAGLLADVSLTVGGEEPHDQSVAAAAAAVARAVADRHTVVVLDGVEGVAEATDAVSALLTAAPSLVVVATSRLPLRIPGALEVPVPPLPVPLADADPRDNPAIRLLRDRAERATIGFDLDPETTVTAVELVRLLDGLPLAIELAAARLRSMRLADVVARLRDTGLGPGAGQEGLVTTISWSVDHLSESARSLLHAMSLLPEDVSLRALDLLGEARSADPSMAAWPHPVDDLAVLVEAGLVRMSTTRVQLRYRVLGPLAGHLRASASTYSTVWGGWRERLARELVTATEAWSQELSSPTGDLALGRFTDERPDAEALIEWALDTGRGPLAAALIHASHRLFIAAGRAGEFFALARGVAQAPLPRADASAVDVAAARAAYHVGQHQEAEARCRAVLLEPQTSKSVAAAAECYLAASLAAQGKVADAETHALRAQSSARDLDAYDIGVVSLSVLAIVAAVRGEFDTERNHYEERLRLARAHGDRSRIGDTLNTLAEIALDEPDLPAAREHSDEALRLAGADRPIERRDALITGARVSVLEGDHGRATTELTTALALARSLGHPLGMAQCARVTAHLALQLGEPERAIRLFAAAHRLAPSPDGGDEPMEGDLRSALRNARAAVGTERATRLWDFGGHDATPAALAEAISACLTPTHERA